MVFCCYVKMKEKDFAIKFVSRSINSLNSTIKKTRQVAKQILMKSIL